MHRLTLPLVVAVMLVSGCGATSTRDSEEAPEAPGTTAATSQGTPCDAALAGVSREGVDAPGSPGHDAALDVLDELDDVGEVWDDDETFDGVNVLNVSVDGDSGRIVEVRDLVREVYVGPLCLSAAS